MLPMKRLLWLPLFGLCCSCEGPEEGGAPKIVSAAPRKSAPTNAPERAASGDSFSTVNAALESLSTGLAADDQVAIRGATAWLAKQGAGAVAPTAAEVKNAQNDLRFRLACLNVLGYLGPPAAGPILEATQSDTPQVRAKATDMLGNIHPSSSQIVSRLIELLDNDDLALRRSAVESLGRIGKPAERAAPQLLAILNGDSDDSLRGAAKTALKKIEPRIGFGKQ
jgi:HEAT repeat protein